MDNKQTLASAKLYLVSKQCLGQKLATQDPFLGCVESLNVIFVKCFGKPASPDNSTFTLYNILNSSPDFQEVDEAHATAGDLIISPTGFSNGSIRNGHTGILAKFGIFSNNSDDGLWEEKWNLETWKSHYGILGGFPIKFYRILDSFAPTPVQNDNTNKKKLSILQTLIALYKRVISMVK